MQIPEALLYLLGRKRFPPCLGQEMLLVSETTGKTLCHLYLGWGVSLNILENGFSRVTYSQLLKSNQLIYKSRVMDLK